MTTALRGALSCAAGLGRLRAIARLSTLATAAVAFASACGDDATTSQTGTAPLVPSWEARAALPLLQQETAVVTLGERVYVVGGLDDRVALTIVHVFDPVSGAWSTAAPLPKPLHHVNGTEVGGRLWVTGALDATETPAAPEVFVFDPATNTWSPRSPMPIGTARGASLIAAIGPKIYVAGGLRSGVSVDDFSVYDTETDTWTTLPRVPVPRDHGGAAAIDGRFYAIAGRNTALLGRVDVFDPATGAWSSRAPLPLPRGGFALAVFDGRIVVAGGEGDRRRPSGVFPEVDAYDPKTDAWTALPPMPLPRHGMGAATIGDVVLVPGGGTIGGLGPTTVVEALRLR